MTPAWLAGFAALLYAIDDGHAMPVGFLANRNVLISTVFGVTAMLAHDCWRRDGRRWGAAVAPVCLLLSLLAKEAGIATCAYLFAYAVVFDRARWGRRLLSLVPYFLVVASWRAVYTGLGHGVAHAGLYVDPLHEPIRFILSLPERIPVLLLGQFAAPPAEISLILNNFYARLHWIGAVVVVAVLFVVMVPLVRRDRVARFWAIGMLLALLPICTTFPADRLLLFVGIGAMGLVAQLFRAVVDRSDGVPPGPLWRGMAVSVLAPLLLMHVVVAPIALAVRSALPVGPKRFERFNIVLPPDPRIAEQVLVVVNPPSVLHCAHFMVENEQRGRPVPLRARFLAPGMQSVTLDRPSADTLVIRPENGFLAWIFEELFRNGAFPLYVGQRIELTGTTVEITAMTADGRPAEARFQFDVPLEDPSLYWMRWKTDRFVPFTPPGIGERVELEYDTRVF
jgi:hypothetical protein